jgi:predicted lipoprotein with Yx(FWY)xxD motif
MKSWYKHALNTSPAKTDVPVTRPRIRTTASVVGAGGALVLLAACGGSGGAHAANPPQQPTAHPADAHSVTVQTRSGPLGTYLTDGSGRTLYLFVADTNGKSACTGQCLTYWPPLTSTTTPVAGAGASAGTLATTADHQVTYDGHPLYYFAADAAAGDTAGQGSDGFGAKWWMVTPSGASITSAAPAAGASTSAPAPGY